MTFQNTMRQFGMRQRPARGMTFAGILAICIIIVLIAVAGLKITPAYIKFNAVQKAVDASKSGGKTPKEVQNAYERNMDINGYNEPKKEQLDVTKKGNDIVVTMRYDEKINLFKNVFVLIEFEATTRPQ
jgi:Domain of unknown function (DUF4845)